EAADSRVELDVDATSLRVREGSGGMQTLGDDDKAGIAQTIDDDVLKRQDIRFRSTRVEPSADGLHVEGELTLRGATRPIAFDLAAQDGTLTGSAVVKQSAWGFKPYSTLFGALKVVDEVEASVAARLPAGSRGGRCPGRGPRA